MAAEVLSRRQLRDLDRHAVETWHVPSLVLMENAGRNAADALEAFLRPAGQGSARAAGVAGAGGVPPAVAVVAGGGNNGGDGLVVARHLHIRGCRVAVFLVADPGRLSGDAAANFDIVRRLGLDIRPRAGEGLSNLSAELRHFDAIIDALGGTGVVEPPRGDLARAIEAVNAAGRPVVALDIPTGLDCDSGQPLGATIKADLTVTMAASKRGFAAPMARQFTGKVVVVDIGIPLPEGMG